jgi:poly-gamma-glutamate synthesis protein (capsule biosynthesis protein)
VQVVPADPATFDRVAEVLDRRGAVASGLGIVPG